MTTPSKNTSKTRTQKRKPPDKTESKPEPPTKWAPWFFQSRLGFFTDAPWGVRFAFACIEQAVWAGVLVVIALEGPPAVAVSLLRLSKLAG